MSHTNVPDDDEESIDPADCIVTPEEQAAAIERFKDATPLVKEIISGSSNSCGIDADFGFDTTGGADGEDD